MKKLTFLLATATVILTTACSQEENDSLPGGADATVTFTASLPSTIATKSYSDGLTATSLSYAVYEAGDNTALISSEDQVTISNLSATVSLTLATGKTYDIIFWADCGSSSPYTFNVDSKTVTVSYDSAVCNDENRDAFYGYVKYTVAASTTEDITLKRPLAQINCGSDDLAAATVSSYVSDGLYSSLTVSKAYTTLDLVSGAASDAQEGVTFSCASVPSGQIFPVDGYEYLAMSYILASSDAEVADVTLTVYQSDESTVLNTVSANNVNIKRNFHTDICGSLLTSDVDFTVNTDPDYDVESVAVTEISISNASSLLDGATPACYVGGTIQLSATVSPSDATDQTVTWSSSATEYATVDDTGLVTGVSAGTATITATANDGSGISATYQISVIEKPSGINIATTSVKLSIDDDTYTIAYTYPEDAAPTVTWSSSNESVASVSDGVVTVVGFGEATITAATGETNIAEGYAASAEIAISIPEGYYNEHFTTDNGNWVNGTDGATMAYYTGEKENYYTISSSSSGRGDIKHNGNVYLDPTSYPIICIRIDDVNDLYSYTRNINLDTSGTDEDGNEYKGNFGGSNNKWATKYKCSDNSAILVYNLSSQEFPTGGLLAKVGTFGTFQIKYADIKNDGTATSADYRYFWFMTFPSENDMTTYLSEWSGETGITYNE